MTNVRDIIEAIMCDYFGEDTDVANIVSANTTFGIKYDRFVRILCKPEKPMFISRRTIREKWNLLHDLGYLTQVNQFASRINLPEIQADFYRS